MNKKLIMNGDFLVKREGALISKFFKELSYRLVPGLYYGQTRAGFLILIKLPLGYGLNLGTGFSSFWSLREWGLTRIDYADHFSNYELVLTHLEEWND